MSEEEKKLLSTQNELLGKYGSILEQQMTESQGQQDLLKRVSGLYDVGADGKLTLNQSKVDELAQLTQLQNDRQRRALEGTLPVSEGTIQRKSSEWQTLKEGAARRGIIIEGDSPETATSSSTSGNELIGQFNRTYKIQEDAERRGELSSMSGNASIGAASAAQASGPSSLMGAYQGLSGSYGQLAQPYANQRQMEYQGALGAYGYKQQLKGAYIQALGQGAGMAAYGLGR
jgi:hypothetical protein